MRTNWKHEPDDRAIVVALGRASAVAGLPANAFAVVGPGLLLARATGEQSYQKSQPANRGGGRYRR